MTFSFARIFPAALFSAGLALLPAPASAAAAPRQVKVTMRDGLRFDPARFSATPGEDLALQIENSDATGMSHNFLLLRPGARLEVMQEVLALGEKGPAADYVPASPDILFHTRLLPVDGTATVQLRVPAAPGIYPYVCSFPGHGLVMYGALYAGVPMPALDKDTAIPPATAQAMIAGGGRRPYVQRLFMPGASPAAIAVALAGSQNFCWDASECRLRYAWQGTFVEVPQGKGGTLAELSSTPWWRAAKGEFPFRFARADSPAPAVKFLGYRMTPDGPEFHYRTDGTDVFEQVIRRPDGPGIALHFRIPRAGRTVFYHGDADASSRWTGSAGTWSGGTVALTPAQAADFTLTLTSALCQP